MAKRREKKANTFDAIIQQFDKPQLEQKVNFFRLLSVAQNAWLGIRESVISIGKSETHKGFKEMLDGMVITLTEWWSLADALEEYDYFFAADEIELVRSAQVTGNMAQVVWQLSEELERNQEVNQKISKAMTYPIMILVLAVLAVIVILVKVMPPMLEMYDGMELPWITVFMLDLSNFFQNYWLHLLIWIISVITAYKLAYSKVLLFKVFIDTILVKSPVIWDVIKTYYMYKFANLLSQFYEAWVSPVVSLRLLSNIFDNFNYKKKMMDVRSDLESWFTLYESLVSSTLFDPILVQIINVWENTWSLTSVLSKISNFYRGRFQNAIDIAMWFIEPILMMFVAGIVWLIVASIFLPMADMIGNVQNM